MRAVREQFVSSDPNVRFAAAALRTLFRDAYGDRFAVGFWDGSRMPGTNGAAFTLQVNSPGALRAAFRPPVDLNAGRAFSAGWIECEGDVEAAVDELLRAAQGLRRSDAIRLALVLRRLPNVALPNLREARIGGKRHSLARDRAAIGFHYDQPVAFYRAFLDPQLVYSCAYFDDGIEDLASAQQAKIRHTLRKLRLQPGERLLDIGCGWGAMVIAAASEFRAQALGVTLSKRQYEEGNRRIQEAGLNERARVELRDYRQLGDLQFDKIVSVGMFEHVGREKLPQYFGAAAKALRPGGLFLNHGIASEAPAGSDGKAGGFIGRFIFPDGELVSIADALGFAQGAGFEVRDVENLREHYTRTLRAWVANLEANRSDAIAASGEQSYRAWRLYMAGSAQGFRTRRLAVYQTLLAKPMPRGDVALPMTRRDLYAEMSS